MSHTLVIRGFDHDTHSQLGDLSRQKGVSINSIVKDAVDQWLKRQKEIPRRHHLILYDEDKEMIRLLKSINSFTKGKDNWFKCFIPSSNESFVELLKDLNWYDIDQNNANHNYSHAGDIMKHFSSILQRIIRKSKNKELCCVDFLLNDIAK
ncbi:MAG: hypothetical protein P0116_13480, partial [Candidatus Nitrosocosmicus sp.]|nr:hypothetical protein [Candidatus Nitrosocosmicus sp.]